jgi:hypothetical protein
MHDKLQTLIHAYATTVSLDERFSWNFAVDKLPSAVINLLPKNNAFQKNVSLKNCLSRHLRCNDFSMEYWVIQTWGGIQRFQKNKINDQRITQLYNSLDMGELSKDLFGRISSLSKVASFFDPSEYAIYDSRAIFSLNWLLLSSGTTDGFFPVPEGRNMEIAKYDIETIIRLKCGEKKGLFIDHKTAYFKYCNLLKKLSPKTWDNEECKKKPFYLEMLLFVLAPHEIVEDIKKSTRIEIQTMAQL